MQTRKLYYEDCHMRSFTATVTGCSQTAKGWEVILDATAFYPEGGGQACDLGTLGTARVLDVRERDEAVIHLCDSPLDVGSEVHGCIDWDRRFDQMQQHTGEHILSGLISRKYGYHNVGFHVGKQAMEVDFDGPIPPEELMELERKANEAIWLNLPIKHWYPEPEELKQVTYRSKKELPWPVRIVQVPGYDSCACCGVHVERTGEVGIIKILSGIKFHQGIRLEMLCGRRAYEFLGAVYNQNRLVSQAFSAKVLQTGDAAQRMNDQLSSEKLRSASLEKKLFAMVAQSYKDAGDVARFEDGLNPGSVRELADAIAKTCGGVAAVFSGSDEAGYGFCLIGPADRVKDLGSKLTKSLEGRGGGKPGSFQGSIRASRQQIADFFAPDKGFCFSCQ